MLIFIIFLSSLSFGTVVGDKDIIPVFLIDGSGVMKDLYIDPNPFFKISTAFFADVVHDVIKKAEVVIIFVEDQFSTEDISTKDALGTPYLNMQEGLKEKKVKYFPKVIDPYKLLNQMFQPHPSNVFYVSTGMDLIMLERRLRHVYIFFRDGKNETRAEALRRHDLIIREVYMVMRDTVEGPVVAFYTGKVNPVLIDKLDFVPIAPIPETKFPGVKVVTDGALFRFVDVFAATVSRRALFNQVPVVAEESWTPDALSTKIAYSDFDLEFKFLFRDKDWLLDGVTLLEGGEEVGRTSMMVGAPWNNAYYCGEPLVIVNNRDGSSVTISEYKIQPLRHRRTRALFSDRVSQTPGYNVATSKAKNSIIDHKAIDMIDGLTLYSNRTNYERRQMGREGDEGDEDDGGGEEGGGEEPAAPPEESGGDSDEFGQTVNCGPYFSVGILASLFVTSISLIILGVGVVALMNCKANDMYDDQHDKPLPLGIER